MLQAINDHIKGWLGIVIVVIIGLPFALWGIQDYISGGTEQFAAKVNDREISERDFETNYTRQRQQSMEKFGGELPFDESILKRQVLDQLINKYIVEQNSYESGYRISDSALSARVMQLFSDNGEFDRDRYEAIARGRGETIPQFEHALREDLRVMQLRDGIVNSSLVSDFEARKLAELVDQERSIKMLRFNLAGYNDSVEVSEEEISSRYELQSSNYMNPENIRVEYVELKGDNLAADVVIDEEIISRMYDDYVAAISQREKRKARHILLDIDDERTLTEAKIDEIKQQLASGETFESIAIEHSQDIGSAKQGGDLGWVEIGQMARPFEDALFALDKGEISEVVETKFGLHLIMLEDVKKEEPLAFAEKRQLFETELKQEAVSSQFYDLSEQLATLAYENPDNLNIVNEVMELKLQVSDSFSRNSGRGIANQEKIRLAAFTNDVLSSNANSDIVELSSDHVVVLRLHEHKPASQKPLDEVRANIETELRKEKAQQQALDAATAARERLEGGESLELIAGDANNIEAFAALKRTGGEDVDRAVSDEVFTFPHPEQDEVVARVVEMLSGDVALVILEQINTPQTIDKARINLIKQQWEQQLANSEFNAVLSSLKAAADVRINQRIFE